MHAGAYVNSICNQDGGKICGLSTRRVGDDPRESPRTIPIFLGETILM
jgi:hypothetical protein